MIGISRVYATGYVSQGHAVMCASYCWLLAWYMFTCCGVCSCSLMCLCVLCVFWLIENHTQKMTTWSYILGLRLVNIYWLIMVTGIHVSNFSCSKFPWGSLHQCHIHFAVPLLPPKLSVLAALALDRSGSAHRLDDWMLKGRKWQRNGERKFLENIWKYSRKSIVNSRLNTTTTNLWPVSLAGIILHHVDSRLLPLWANPPN